MEFCELKLSSLVLTANRSRFSFPRVIIPPSGLLLFRYCAFFFFYFFTKHSQTLSSHTLCLFDSLFALLEVRAFLHISSNTCLMDFFCIQAHDILTLEESSPSKENADICGHVLHEPHNPSLSLLSGPAVDFLEV